MDIKHRFYQSWNLNTEKNLYMSFSKQGFSRDKYISQEANATVSLAVVLMCLRHAIILQKCNAPEYIVS